MRNIIYLLTVGAWLLAACASPAPAGSADTPGGQAAAPTVAAPALTANPTLAPTVVVPTAAPTATTAREVKTGFEATDPSTVQLAAGKPQLVEFFAVW